MNWHRLVVWWPLIGLLAVVGLGVAVGRGSTPVDGWFTRAGDEHRAVCRLLFFTDARLLLSILVVCLAVALYQRRWRLVAAIVATPVSRSSSSAWPSGRSTEGTTVRWRIRAGTPR